MNTVYRSSLFDTWLRSLRDKAAQARIFNRIRNVEQGNLGDYKPLGGGLFELRVHHRDTVYISPETGRRLSSCWLAEISPHKARTSSEPEN